MIVKFEHYHDSRETCHDSDSIMIVLNIIKVMGNALNIEYYFWWRDDCFGLLIHHDALFHFMVSISDEYKYKRL